VAINPFLVQALGEVGVELSKVLLKKLPQFRGWKSKDETLDPPGQQIAELQAAVRDNADSVRTLAEELKKTVAALERGAAEADVRLRRVRTIAILAAIVAIAAIATAAAALLS
jgi:hypothetical protein